MVLIVWCPDRHGRSEPIERRGILSSGRRSSGLRRDDSSGLEHKSSVLFRGRSFLEQRKCHLLFSSVSPTFKTFPRCLLVTLSAPYLGRYCADP